MPVEVLTITGPVDDADARELRGIFDEILFEGGYRILCRVSGLGRISSAALNVFEQTRWLCQTNGGDLVFSAPGTELARRMDDRNLDVPVFDDDLAAYKHLVPMPFGGELRLGEAGS